MTCKPIQGADQQIMKKWATKKEKNGARTRKNTLPVTT